MNLKHVTVVGITALALAACGGPAAQNPTTVPAATAAGAGATNAPAAAGTTAGATAPAAGGATSAPAAPTVVVSTDPTIVARLGDVSLTRGELDTRINRIQAGIAAQGAATGQPAPANIEIEKSLVDLFVNEVLTLNVANDRSVAVSNDDIDAQIKQISDNISAQGGTIEEAITTQLGFENAQAPEFRMFISSIVASDKIAQTLVTTDTVETEVRATVEAEGKQEVKKADVRHILFASQSADTDAAAKTKAEDVIKRLNNGEDFAALAKELSEDPGSKDNGGLYQGVVAGQFVPEFDQAMFTDLQPGQYTKQPVKTQFGYHVIKLEKLTTGPRYTAEEVEQKVTEGVTTQLQQKRGEELQKLIDAARQKATAAGQLVQPAYPEPTPEPAPAETPGAEAPADATAAPDATTQP